MPSIRDDDVPRARLGPRVPLRRQDVRGRLAAEAGPQPLGVATCSRRRGAAHRAPAAAGRAKLQPDGRTGGGIDALRCLPSEPLVDVLTRSSWHPTKHVLASAAQPARLATRRAEDRKERANAKRFTRLSRPLSGRSQPPNPTVRPVRGAAGQSMKIVLTCCGPRGRVPTRTSVVAQLGLRESMIWCMDSSRCECTQSGSKRWCSTPDSDDPDGTFRARCRRPRSLGGRSR